MGINTSNLDSGEIYNEVAIFINENSYNPNYPYSPIQVADNNNKNTKDTARRASGINPTAIEVPNTPFGGVKLYSIESSQNYKTTYKCVTKEGYLFDLHEETMFEIMMSGGVALGGELNGEFVWGRIAQRGAGLISVESDTYKKIRRLEVLKNMKCIPSKNLEKFGVYQTKKGKIYLYLGKMYRTDFQLSPDDFKIQGVVKECCYYPNKEETIKELNNGRARVLGVDYKVAPYKFTTNRRKMQIFYEFDNSKIVPNHEDLVEFFEKEMSALTGDITSPRAHSHILKFAAYYGNTCASNKDMKLCDKIGSLEDILSEEKIENVLRVFSKNYYAASFSEINENLKINTPHNFLERVKASILEKTMKWLTFSYKETPTEEVNTWLQIAISKENYGNQ